MSEESISSETTVYNCYSCEWTLRYKTRESDEENRPWILSSWAHTDMIARQSIKGRFSSFQYSLNRSKTQCCLSTFFSYVFNASLWLEILVDTAIWRIHQHAVQPGCSMRISKNAANISIIIKCFVGGRIDSGPWTVGSVFSTSRLLHTSTLFRRQMLHLRRTLRHETTFIWCWRCDVSGQNSSYLQTRLDDSCHRSGNLNDSSLFERVDLPSSS